MVKRAAKFLAHNFAVLYRVHADFADVLALVRKKIDWWVNGMQVHSFTVSGPFVAHDRFVVQYDADVTEKSSNVRCHVNRSEKSLIMWCPQSAKSSEMTN